MQFFLFAADLSGKDKVGNPANASAYEEVKEQSSKVYETETSSNDTHVYEGLGERKR